MILRPEIQFSSSFPDDAITEGDDDVEWPGRNITDVLKAGLEGLGYRVSHPIDVQHKGWELDIWRGRKRLWLQVSVLDADLNYLIAENMTSFLWRDAELFRTFLLDLQGILQADERFIRIGWFAKGGIERGDAPAAGPVDV